MVESKTLLEYCQGLSSTQPAPIKNKEEEGGVAFVDQRNTSAAKKAPKGKCHKYGMFNDHLLSDCKVISEEAKKMIMASKRQ